MTPPPEFLVLLMNWTLEGDETASGVFVTPEAVITRSVGGVGDQVRVALPYGILPGAFDLLGEFGLVINPGAGEVVLRGYRLVNREPTDFGRPVDEPTGTVVPFSEVLTLETVFGSLRDGRGGLLTEGTLNELNENGLVDTEASTYLTNQELVDLCLDALGLPHEACPAEVDEAPDGSVIDAPGPLDWGNARPLPELEAVLARLGWAVVLLNSGTVRVVRMARAGEPVDLGDLADDAEPYDLGVAPGVRGSKILVTSGATRTTVITSRALSQMVWVHYDPRLGHWLQQSDFDVLYPDEPGPEDIDAFREGVTTAEYTPEYLQQHAQLFRAVGLDGADFTKANRFVNIPSEVTAGSLAPFRGSPGVVEAKCCQDLGSDQFVNVPLDGADPAVRIDGVQAVAREAVFILPKDYAFVRVNGGTVGRRSDCRMLTGSELTIVFAHESNSGVYVHDYAVFGYELIEDEGEPELRSLTDEEVEAAVADPTVIKVGMPTLRRVVLWPSGDTDPTPLNDDTLEPIARQAAWNRLAEDELASGTITLRGVLAVEPGALGGAVSRVVYDWRSSRTYLAINQQERPRSEQEQTLKAVAGSVAAGVSRINLDRSSAARSDVRAQLTAERGGGSAVIGSPDGNAVQRGQDRANASVQPSVSEGAGNLVRPLREQTTILAKITGSTPMDGEDNRYIYDWEEVRVVDGLDADNASAVRTSGDYGPAVNAREDFNSDTGVQGNGLDLADFPEGWAVVPIGPCTVTLHGPFPGTEGDVWRFEADNQLAGECEGGTAPEVIDGGAP